jgi:hypothetical protein
MFKAFVLVYTLTLSPGVTWFSDSKFQTLGDCMMVKKQMEFLAESHKLKLVIEEHCVEKTYE